MLRYRILQLAWKEERFHGSWKQGVSAGGSRNGNSAESFASNPQFGITLQDFDAGDHQCTVIVALMRKNVVGHSKKDDVSIGFHLYDVSSAVSKSMYLTVHFRSYMHYYRNFINQLCILVRFQVPIFLGMKEVTPKKGRHWKRLFASFFRQNAPCGASDYTQYREIVKRFTVKPGNYVIMPFTKHSNKEGEFLLRVFSEKPSGLIQGSW